MNFLKNFPSTWILNLATLGPVGYWGMMPGTSGTFVGLIWYTLFFHEATPPTYLFLGCLSIFLACAVCTQAEILLRRKDPHEVILDEVVAMPFCFLGLQPAMNHYPVWCFMLLGFLFFRFFDIVKPFGIKKLQVLPGGRGIVFDDIAAAFCTCLLLHLTLFFVTS